jgi:hypothetical protein
MQMQRFLYPSSSVFIRFSGRLYLRKHCTPFELQFLPLPSHQWTYHAPINPDGRAQTRPNLATLS